MKDTQETSNVNNGGKENENVCKKTNLEHIWGFNDKKSIYECVNCGEDSRKIA